MQPATIITGEQPLISVWLDDSHDHDKILRNFHCPVCGKIVFQHYGSIRILVPGETEDVQGVLPKVIQCHGTITIYKDGMPITKRCKAKYWVN